MRTVGSCFLVSWLTRSLRFVSWLTVVIVLGGVDCAAVAADDVLSLGGAFASGIRWNDSFFGLCRGDCAVSVFGGREMNSSMERVLFIKYPPRPFWTWHWRDSEFIGAAFSRRLVTIWDAVAIEPEIGAGKRFGEMHAAEFWAALNLRWTWFPWNNYVKTTIGVAEGLSMATQVDTAERLQNQFKIVGNRLVFTGSDLLNYFSPEVTLALPQYPEYELMFRLHHRSGIFGLINGVHAGAQYVTAGLRVYF